MRLRNSKSICGLRKKEKVIPVVKERDRSLNLLVPVFRNQATE